MTDRRDRLAELMGWVRPTTGDYAGKWINPTTGGGPLDDHPIPDTLDFYAGALPEGWRWRYIGRCPGHDCGDWIAISTNRSETERRPSVEFGPDERSARLACVIAAWEAEKGAKHGEA